MTRAEKLEDMYRLQGKLRYLDVKILHLERMSDRIEEPENGRNNKTGY